MAFSSGFFNSKNFDRTYTAENFNDYLSSIICNGIQDNYGDCFKLLAASSGLKVSVGRGKAWINGHYFINDARYSIDLSEYMDESLPRYVGIAIYLDTTEAVRSVTLRLFPGTPAESPSLPSIPQDADHVRLLMYAVRLNPGATSLNERDWYDYREDANVCGYCKCILGKCQVTVMQAQLALLLSHIDEYNEQVAELTNKVDVLQTKVDDLTGDIVETGELGEDIYYVLYSNGKLLIRGTGATYDYTWPLDGTPVNSPLCDNQNIKNVVVSDGITKIGDYLFRYCDTMESISLPNTLTEIGRMTFYPHTDDHVPPSVSLGLSSITFPPNITTIGYCAFAGTRIREVIVPATVTSMGERAFTRCVHLTTVRFEAAEIPQFAFVTCPNLSDVTLAKTVTKIGSHWINYCDRLTEITYEGSLEDWAAVTKQTNWDGNQGQLTGSLRRVICLDGYMEYDAENNEWNEVRE